MTHQTHKFGFLSHVRVALVMSLIVSCTAGWAQEKSVKRTTEYNFEDDVLSVSLVQPADELIIARLRATKIENLIQIREEFNEKVKASVNEM